MAKLVDARDLKSLVQLDVRVRSPVLVPALRRLKKLLDKPINIYYTEGEIGEILWIANMSA